MVRRSSQALKGRARDRLSVVVKRWLRAGPECGGTRKERHGGRGRGEGRLADGIRRGPAGPARSADRRRRDRGLQGARPDPPPARARGRRARRDDRVGQEFRHAARGGEPHGRARPRGAVLAHRRIRDGPYRAVAQRRPAAGRPRDRQSPGQDGQWSRRRPRLDAAARHRQARADGAFHERPHVASPGDAAQRRPPRRRRGPHDRPRRGLHGLRRVRARPDGGAARHRGGGGARPGGRHRHPPARGRRPRS